MGKKAVRIGAFLLAMALFLSLIGCGPTSDNPGKDSSSGQTTNPSGSDTEFVSKYADKEMNLGGRVIRIANQKWWKPTSSNIYMDRIIENIEYYESKWNFTLEWVYPAGADEEYHQKLSSSVLSGNPVADIAWVDSTYLFPGFMASGVVQDLNALNVFDYTDKKWVNDIMDVYATYKDKLYGLSVYGFNASGYYKNIGWGMFFNKEYFEENSLPDLYEIVREGKWTWNKMIEVAKQATITTGGNKTYGLTIWQDAFPFFNAGSTRLVTDNKDGTYTFNGTDANILRALNYYFDNAATTLPAGTELYPWIHPHTGNWDFPMASFKNGESAMCVAPWNTLDWYMSNIPFEWGWIPFPKETESGEYASFNAGDSLWCLLNNIDKPEDVALVFDAITDVEQTEEDYIYFFENQADDDETVEMVGLLLYDAQNNYDIGYSFPGFYDRFWAAFDKVRLGTATTTSAMESIQDAQQAMINDVAERLKNSIK